MPYKDPEMARARRRNRDHLKRVEVSDVTAAQELAMRKRARKCPLCGVRMTSKPHLPSSKELDHILPVNQGGTHTHGNVRIICRRCNQARPKDGSDYLGPLTLWAQDPGVVSRERETCRNGLHPWVPDNIEDNGNGKRRCIACRVASQVKRGKWRPLQQCKCGAMFAAPGRQFMCAGCITAAGHRAAELHARGAMSWREVAQAVGYGSANGEGARYAAKRIGYSPEPQPPKKAAPQRTCQCGAILLPRAHQCSQCATAKLLASSAKILNRRRARRCCPGCGSSTQNYRWCDDCMCSNVNAKGRRCGNVAGDGGQCEFHTTTSAPLAVTA